MMPSSEEGSKNMEEEHNHYAVHAILGNAITKYGNTSWNIASSG